MKNQQATLVALHIGMRDDMSKQACDSIKAELDGFVGDKHRGYSRVCYAGDTEPEGTVRRNNRQWSGMSAEELQLIAQQLDLEAPISVEDLGVNLCFKGIEKFSQLGKGDKLVFPSGATLVVEDYNPPCVDMGDKIGELYTTKSGQTISRRDFVLASRRTRGLVGCVDVPGVINSGDNITVKPYQALVFD